MLIRSTPGVAFRASRTLALFLAFCAVPAFAQADSVPTNIEQAQEDLAFARGVEAYVWAYPLAITAATAEIATNTDKPLPNGHAPFNSFGHVGKLMTAADKDVVSPNADTIYSSAFVDLKQGAALISVPDTGGRYYSLMLEDAYTNIFGYIGSRATGGGAGQYLIAGPGWHGDTPAGRQAHRRADAARLGDRPHPRRGRKGHAERRRAPAAIHARHDSAGSRSRSGEGALGHRVAAEARPGPAGRYARLEDLLTAGPAS